MQEPSKDGSSNSLLTLVAIAVEGVGEVIDWRRRVERITTGVLRAQHWSTLEVILTESPKQLRRQANPESGNALIRL